MSAGRGGGIITWCTSGGMWPLRLEDQGLTRGSKTCRSSGEMPALWRQCCTTCSGTTADTSQTPPRDQTVRRRSPLGGDVLGGGGSGGASGSSSSPLAKLRVRRPCDFRARPCVCEPQVRILARASQRKGLVNASISSTTSMRAFSSRTSGSTPEVSKEASVCGVPTTM